MSLSLEHAFTRLSLSVKQPSSICRQCRRTFATVPRKEQQQRRNQSATAAFADLLESNRTRSTKATMAYTPSSPSSTSPQGPLGQTASTASPKTPTPSPTSTSGWSMIAQDAVHTATQARKEIVQRQMLLDQERGWNRQDLEKQANHRRWKQGDVYAPHDLTGVEMAKWKKLRRKPKPRYDVLDRLAINPLDHYKNFSIMSEYITEMGRIKHSNDTNLRPVNQRRMAKAIRRAIGLGILMPSTHRHPEILRMTMLNRRR